MKYLKEFFILILCLFLGSIMREIIHFPIPEAVYGMIFLFIFLAFKKIHISDVETTSDVLLQNLAFFFVPAGVGLIEDYGKIKNEVHIILLILFISSLVGMFVTAKTVEWIQRRGKKNV